ncbi:hypothetical protein EV421DRAFT_2013890 [Armillaria borealis]|uniref:Heterokaryon incompatibility domain-containing protein n=1 Tax=Armillaria borealis TaxID=47425 RepID=A0AA39K9G8_9AGAR|nr:hypothetical protein EV421DRAFT_2013890 [Armillaria borealis]
MQPRLEPQHLEHNMDLSNARSDWESVKLKAKVAAYKWMYRKVLCKLPEDDLPGRTSLLPGVTISCETEIGQMEESIEVPNQRAYTSEKPVISSFLAGIPCSSLGIRWLLNLLNRTLGTSYTLDTLSLPFVLKDCIAQNYDFGTAYGRLRSAWCNEHRCIIQLKLWEHEAKDIKRRRKAVKGSRIVDPNMDPRRVWDLYSNRVVPWWSCRVNFRRNNEARPISHAWVDEVDRVDVWTPINGYEWPVPIPKGANLDLIRIEMLNLGVQYTWLDVLCLRQRGGPREDLRVEEWKLDVVCYLSGLGLPLSLKEGSLESDRCWFRRAWTVQEVGEHRTIAGDTPDGPMNVDPIDKAGNYEDEILTKFHKQLDSAGITNSLYGALSAMQGRISTYPVDKVAGLAFSLGTRSIPAYYESQSLEDAWTALVNEMHPTYRGKLFFTYPEPGTTRKKWRPSWEQVMNMSMPIFENGFSWLADVGRKNDVDDWCDELHIERGFVRGLAVGGGEGIGRCGELVVEDADGIVHSFNIFARHQYLIPEDTYTLIGSKPRSWGCIPYPLQYWVVGRRLPSKTFEKVSVFTMTDMDETKRLIELNLSVKSRSILA